MKLLDYDKKPTRYDITVELDNGHVLSYSVLSLSVLDIKLGAEQITKEQAITAINRLLQALPENKQI